MKVLPVLENRRALGPCSLQSNVLPLGEPQGCRPEQSLLDHGTGGDFALSSYASCFYWDSERWSDFYSVVYLVHARLIPKVWDMVRTFCFSITTRWNKL